jgi:superfamily II DNA or RNA helicase
MHVILEAGNVYMKVNFPDGTPHKDRQAVIDYLRNNLKYPNSYWSQQANEYIEAYTYLVTPKGRVATGLVGYVTGLLKAADFTYEIVNKQTEVETPDEADIVRRLRRLKYNLRPYQLDAVFEGISTRRAMFDMATGAGKSLVMAAIMGVWDLKTLVVVNSKDLMYQLRDDIEEYLSEPVGVIGDGKWIEQRITVGMVSTLTRSKAHTKKGKKIREFCRSIDHLVYDEVHHAQARTWRQVGEMCVNAPLRHGFSGTCFSSEVMIEHGQRVSNRDALLIAHTGKVAYKIKAKELIDMGYLSRPKILMIQNELYEDSVKLHTSDEYLRIIAKDDYRNGVACSMTQEAYNNGEQTIIFVTRIEHGERVRDMLVDEHGINPADVAFVSGQDDNQTRKETIADFKAGDLPIIIGTVLGEGLNFYPKLGINLAGGQSKKDIIQRLGRPLRKKPDPNTGDANTEVVSEITYVDFQDRGHKWYERHGATRYRTYLEEGHEVEAVHYVKGTLLPSTVDKLAVKGDTLKAVYNTFEKAHRSEVGRWTWESGQKPRVKKLFVELMNALNIRENSRLDEGLELFTEYLVDHTKKWLKWDKATPANYLGFLANQKSVDFFAAQKLVPAGDKIAGTQGDDYWDW